MNKTKYWRYKHAGKICIQCEIVMERILERQLKVKSYEQDNDSDQGNRQVFRSRTLRKEMPNMKVHMVWSAFLVPYNLDGPGCI